MFAVVANARGITCTRTHASRGMTHGRAICCSLRRYNLKYEFSVTWVNNCEKWIGPDHRSGETSDLLYKALVEVVAQDREGRRRRG